MDFRLTLVVIRGFFLLHRIYPPGCKILFGKNCILARRSRILFGKIRGITFCQTNCKFMYWNLNLNSYYICQTTLQGFLLAADPLTKH